MKKFLSLVLVSGMLLSAVACGMTETAEISSSASAGMEKYVTLFEERVEAMPTSLTIAVGDDAAAYGVDVDKFIDNEGYTVRASEGDVVILAKSAAGADRAVRHFTNYGNYDNYSFTYGEGYKVKNLTVMGKPIEGFAVVRPDDADEAMRYATDELVRYVRSATGVTLPVYSATDYAADAGAPANAITLAIDYPALGDEAFTIDVKADGNIDILCGRYRGGLYGVYGLLRDMGWRFIADGTEYVYESEGLDITEDCDRTEEAAVANRFASAFPLRYDNSIAPRLNMHGRYLNGAQTSKYGFYGIVAEACHGLDTHNIDWQDTYAGFTATYNQPCFTNEDVLQAIEDHYRAYIERELAAGKVIGRELSYVDVAQFDTGAGGFCLCSDCIAVLAEEGGHSGAVLRMTNRIADIAAEYDPDLPVLMLAYAGTNKPPKVTVPRDNVKISYCFYVGAATGFFCSNHNIYDENCENNRGYYDEFESWKKICGADKLQVWYYPLNCYEIAVQIPTFDVIYGDMKYFIESEIDCIMFCEEFNNDDILLTLLCDLMWYGDMTEEEYWERVQEYFNIYYGDGGQYVYEYICELMAAADKSGCFTNFATRVAGKLDYSYMASRFEYMVGLFDTALKYAETEEIANRIEMIKARMLYACINAAHESCYVNGTAEQRAIFEERYTEMHRLFKKYSIKVFDDYTAKLYAPDEIDFTKTPTEHWCTK